MRSLRMKLVLIMVLLIVALMTVVGSFLINGVGSFYINRFYTQMSGTFSQEFISRVQEAAGYGPQRMKELLMSQSDLGVDLGSRNVYILDDTGRYLDGSAGADELGTEMTVNMLTALNGEVGQESSVVSSYMDLALPISSPAGEEYIVYIRDNKSTVNDLSSEMLMIILQSLLLGLIICVVLSFLLAEILITPIQELTRGASRLRSGDFSQRPEVNSGDEIGVLTETFNDMADTIESTLKDAENERSKLSTLFLHMTDGVVAFDRRGRMIHANPAASVMLGRELTDETVYADIFGDVTHFNALLALKRPQFIAAEKKSGQRELELYLAPFSGEDEKLGGVLAVLHDATERRKAEEMRREFVANVSHELRTPLTNIKSYTETIVESEAELPPELKAQFFGVILSETDRMTRIVQDLLTLSRFDYGKMEMNVSTFPFAQAVKNVHDAVVIDAGNHGHTLLLELPDGLPEIRGDKERVEQVIMNIVSNAIKYTPDGGEISISAGCDGKNVWASVKDNGIGIPEKDIPRLFERFYRVDKARSRESGGTGLGLSIAREIARMHGGEINVKSKAGEGTEMTLTLPVGGRAS